MKVTTVQIHCWRCDRMFAWQPRRGRRPTRCDDCRDKPQPFGACVWCGCRIVRQAGRRLPQRCDACLRLAAGGAA